MSRARKPHSVVPRSRREIATTLVARIERGPTLSSAIPGEMLTPLEALSRYRCWISTWIEDDLKYLLHNDIKAPK